MEEKKQPVAIYWLVDVVNNNYEMLQPTSSEELERMAELGFAFVAEYPDETRQAVKWNEIDFDNMYHGTTINIVEQEYFVPLLESLVSYLESTEAPAVATLSTAKTRNVANTKFQEFKSIAEELIERYRPNIEGDSNVTH